MKNKTQTLACPQASSTRASGPLRKKHRMSSAALAGLVLALAPAAQAVTIYTDGVDGVSADYTGGGIARFYGVGIDDTGTQGVTSQDGLKHGRLSTSYGSSTSGEATLIAGFGSGNEIQAGTYVFTISVGDNNSSRSGFTTFEHRLQTTIGATVLPGASLTTAYVPLVNQWTGDGGVTTGTPNTAEWTTTVITYTVGLADVAFIGQEFTWGADVTGGADGNGIYGAFDKVHIEFTAVPEPSTTGVLAIAGVLGLLRRRRA